MTHIPPSDGAAVRILIVEDSVADTELVLRELRTGGLVCEHERIDTRTQWERAMANPARWDIILFDYALPNMKTLELLGELAERAPDLPSLVVPGTITEESAVSALRAGARDFITKQRLARLVPAVVREIAAADEVRARRTTERELEESEARFARLIENAQDIVMRFQIDPLAFDYVSPSVQTILALSPESFYEDPTLALRTIHPEDRDAIAAAYADDPERPVTGRAIAGDGHVVWLDCRQVAIRDDAGKITGLEIVARDVTEQIRANAEVRAKEHKFRAIFEGSLDAILLADDDRVYVDANPAASELLGIPRDEILGHRIDDFNDPAGAAALVANWTEFLKAGKGEGEFELLRPDGAKRDVEYKAAANVRPGVHLSILRDVSEQHAAQQRQRETDERVQTMLAELPLVVFSIPVVPGTGASFVSPQSLELLGLPVEAWDEQPELFWDAVHPDDLERIKADQSRDRSATDFRLRPVDGRELTVHGQHRLLRDENGVPTYYEGFIADVTELNASHQALRESERMLRQAQKMEAIGQLAGGIAHDFNNLLTVINGYGDIALDNCADNEKVRHSVTEIRRAGDRAAELTQQLLAFSRQQVLKPEILDLNDVVADHANLLARLIGEDIELQVTLNARDGFIEADPGQLAQVILNLGANARDAMPDGGRLSIETRSLELAADDAASSLAAGRYVMLEISDTGCGIDTEIQPHVFEPFFTTKPVGEGTGLGLSTVLGIIEQSSGRVLIESERDRGTTFRIYLPQAAAPSVEQDAKPDRGGDGSELVLLVEDDPIVRSLIEEILSERGYVVLAAGSPDAALAIAATHEGEIRLLVTDIVMPAMNGRELAARIQEIRPAIKTLFMSGYTNDAVISRGLLPVDTLFLQKPFSAPQLGVMAREALNLPERALESTSPGGTVESPLAAA